jgi:hypothetical protein
VSPTERQAPVAEPIRQPKAFVTAAFGDSDGLPPSSETRQVQCTKLRDSIARVQNLVHFPRYLPLKANREVIVHSKVGLTNGVSIECVRMFFLPPAERGKCMSFKKQSG